MGNRRKTPLRTVLAAAMLLGMLGGARANTDGLVLRAVGFFQGEQSNDGRCIVPTVDSGITDYANEIGLLNTFGLPTVSYPRSGDACGGWIELQNMQTGQGITIDNIDIRLRIAGAGQFRQFVPTRNGFPTQCRALRHIQLFAGAHLFPLGTPDGVGNTGGGVAHLAFIQLQPMISAQTMRCLQEQYVTLPADVYSSFPVVIRAFATGFGDDGRKYKSNPIQYTLTLNHLCGNGRVDVTEECDPNAPNTCFGGACDITAGVCKAKKDVPCVTDADCLGVCLPQGDPMECSCVY
jgi:hypothetical protein